jgi:hypothetical protein
LYVAARLAAVRLAEDHAFRLGHDELLRGRRRQRIPLRLCLGLEFGQGFLDPLALGRLLGRVDQGIGGLEILQIALDRHLVRGDLGLHLLPRLPPLAAAGRGEPAAVGRDLPGTDQPAGPLDQVGRIGRTTDRSKRSPRRCSCENPQWF